VPARPRGPPPLAWPTLPGSVALREWQHIPALRALARSAATPPRPPLLPGSGEGSRPGGELPDRVWPPAFSARARPRARPVRWWYTGAGAARRCQGAYWPREPTPRGLGPFLLRVDGQVRYLPIASRPSSRRTELQSVATDCNSVLRRRQITNPSYQRGRLAEPTDLPRQHSSVNSTRSSRGGPKSRRGTLKQSTEQAIVAFAPHDTTTEEAQLTQRELGRRLGKPQSWVCNCASPNRRVDVTEFIAWATVCGVEPQVALANFLAL
jgi:hypothetical protein